MLSSPSSLPCKLSLSTAPIQASPLRTTPTGNPPSYSFVRFQRQALSTGPTLHRSRPWSLSVSTSAALTISVQEFDMIQEFEILMFLPQY
ncbi:uncharacterized protein LACBIDRAFT_317621 [Laccaria bicolor S238N-H82]|uniref:Predicted protein n=1 Tax=Laccaria bicolor (strain S238N-H82 / ATCC MYA-4686) TaxID=486041 RepID=B0E224_LACBS|nr:uncharacterized protein LACBIDRAFT_317621 [Laccaria bicolor S238N-H82]EDQ99097.1 predicted protein [Laccaria bicolor S238N-H82]|eukprot:XP_001890230.1 predicted protein [Laccaria bicolor S238N-H82]